jgi:DivIVA domain-containing protein
VVTVLGLLGVVAVLFATAVLATRSDPLLADVHADRPDLPLPDGPLTAGDVEGVRFSLAVRGYRMDEVDAVLARLSAELAERDRRLAGLGPAAPAGGLPRLE